MEGNDMKVIDADALNEKLERLAIQRIKGNDGCDILTVSLADVLQMIDGLSTIELEAMFADRMSRRLDALGLPVREYNCLRRYGIDTIAELYKVKQDGMLPKVRNLGRKSMERVEKALDEFIRVEQLPPTQHGTNLAEVGTDCISRQQAIDALKGCYCGGEDSCGEPWIYEDNAIKAVEQLPPIQPKRGKWIKISPANIYECSECGKSVMTSDICAYDFCHGCGAKMESEVTE